MLHIEGNWFDVKTTAGTLYNVKANTNIQAIQKVKDYTGGANILDVWQPSSLEGKIISQI